LPEEANSPFEMLTIGSNIPLPSWEIEPKIAEIETEKA